MHGYSIRARRREFLYIAFGLLNHEVYVAISIDIFERAEQSRPERYIGHEHAVHHVEVQPVRARREHAVYVRAHVEPVSRE